MNAEERLKKAEGHGNLWIYSHTICNGFESKLREIILSCPFDSSYLWLMPSERRAS